jgi:hypothetical protein
MRRTQIIGTAAATLALILLGGCGSSPSPASSGSSTADGTSGGSGASTSAPPPLRDVRYCEVIPAVTSGGTVTSTVYNTLGFNNCPERQWNNLTEDMVNQEYGSQSAQLNGPRHWVIDLGQQPAAPAPTDGTPTTFTFGGIEMGIRGQLTSAVGAPAVGDQYYVVNTVARNTVWTYLKGTMIYELTDPGGNVYVMQSYSTQINPALNLQELPTLAQTLSLPPGWTFATETLDNQLNLVTGGTAYVINDNFVNSYQKRTELDTTGPTS